MKKGRPGHLVHVLCDPVRVRELRGVLRSETGSLGVRMTLAERWPAARSIDSVVVDGQLIRMKVERDRVKAEHDDVVVAARRTGRPLREMAFRAEAHGRSDWHRLPANGAQSTPDGRMARGNTDGTGNVGRMDSTDNVAGWTRQNAQPPQPTDAAAGTLRHAATGAARRCHRPHIPMTVDRVRLSPSAGCAGERRWIVRGDPPPRPVTSVGAAPSAVPVVRLEVVVPMAEPDQILHAGLPAVGVRGHVIDLQAFAAAAPGDDADRIPFGEGPPERCRNGAAGVGHPGDVDPVGDQDAQDRVDRQTPCHLDRDRADPGDLAELSRLDPAADQRGVVDTDVDHGPGTVGSVTACARPAARQRDQGVGVEGAAAPRGGRPGVRRRRCGRPPP